MTFDGPLAASAYELLGVATSASEDELRRAYRMRLRETHPDTGGDAAVFIRVQRAWQLVGSPEARAVYDREHEGVQWGAPRASDAGSGSRPRTQSYGTPGGYRRLKYQQLLTEHLERTVAPDELYAPTVVRAAPWEARRMLADALAEESAAAAIADLGIGFTAWHDVVSGADAAQKLDHAVLGPAGLYGLASEDYGDTVRFRQGEAIGRTVDGSTPVADLLTRIRSISRATRVRFAGAILILPDDDLDDLVTVLGAVRGVQVAAVRRSALRTVLRGGIPGARPLGMTEAFDVRTRLTQNTRVLVP